MTITRLPRPVLAVALLALVTGCGASSAPDAPEGTPTGSETARTPTSANPRPVAAVMPDLIGGNAGRAIEQMGSDLDAAFQDASGQDRPVDDPAAWKICTSRPGPQQRITEYPVVFGVMKVAENCQDAAPE
jgi:hypothetical protein